MSNDYRPSTYGDRIAEVYDDMYAGLTDVEVMATALADLAQGGRALELGIGTGRVALPLAARGVEVHGIDASEAMIERLRAKEGGADIPVTIGDFAGVDVEGQFALVFVVFNTLFGPLSRYNVPPILAFLLRGKVFSLPLREGEIKRGCRFAMYRSGPARNVILRNAATKNLRRIAVVGKVP